jgi:hypothetical protein
MNSIGFGSGAPRFPKKSNDKTPGPGAYSPKEPLPPTSTKGTWSKASRKLTAHQQNQLLQKNPLDSMHEKLKSGYKFQKTQLKDGRNVFILGGLARDVKTFQRLCKTYASSHKDDCIQIQKNLLKNVNDELHSLICNVDLETDEFVSKEVALIKELHGILSTTQQTLMADNPLMTKNNELIDQLIGRYTEQSNVVSVQFSGEPEYITRMAKALREKRASLQDKTFVIKDAAGDQEKSLREFTSDSHAKVLKDLTSSGSIDLDQYKKIGSGGTQDVYQVNDSFVLKVHREKQPLTKQERTSKLSQNQAAYETLAQHFGAHFIPETLFITPISDSSGNKVSMVAVSSFEPGFKQPEKIALQSESFQWNDIQIAETEDQLGIYRQMNKSMLGITDPLPKETLDAILQGNDLVCKINDDPDLKSAVSKFLTTFETYYKETGQLIDIMGPDNVMFLKDQGQWTFKIGSVIKKESQKAIADALTQSDDRHQLKLLRTSLTFIVALNTLGQFCLGRNIIQGDNVDRMANLYKKNNTLLTREPKDVGMVRDLVCRLDVNDLDVINEYSDKTDIFLSYIQSDRQRGEYLTRMIQTMHDTVPKKAKYGEFRFGLASKLIDEQLMPKLAIELLTEVKNDENAPQTRINKMIQDLSKHT